MVVKSFDSSTIPIEYNGFVAGRGCPDMHFVVQQTFAKSKEFGRSVFAAKVDVRKAFDCVNRCALLSSLERRALPRIWISYE